MNPGQNPGGLRLPTDYRGGREIFAETVGEGAAAPALPVCVAALETRLARGARSFSCWDLKVLQPRAR